MGKAYGRDMRVGSRKIVRRKLGVREADILKELSAGDVLVGMLCGSRSVRRGQQVAYARAHDRAMAKYRDAVAVTRMQKKGLLVLREERDGTYASLTESGRFELSIHAARRGQNVSWDGTWRIVFFDIPETNAQLRQELRRLLQDIGYLHMQRSVYVYPYAVPLLEKMIAEKSLPVSQLAFAEVRSLSSDAMLRRHFKL